MSAEPHFAVTVPSRAIVLQNLGKHVHGKKFNIEGLKQRIDYSGLPPQSQAERKDVPSDLVQARYALEIAEGADADRLAAKDYEQASELLARAEAAHRDKKSSVRAAAPQFGRDAVQVAEDARRNAVLAHAAEQRESARQAAEQKAAMEAAAASEEAQRREEAAVAATSSAARADLIARLNKALPTRDTPRGIVAELAGVEFATGSPKLGPSARESLSRFAGIVGVYPVAENPRGRAHGQHGKLPDEPAALIRARQLGARIPALPGRFRRQHAGHRPRAGRAGRE